MFSFTRTLLRILPAVVLFWIWKASLSCSGTWDSFFKEALNHDTLFIVLIVSVLFFINFKFPANSQGSGEDTDFIKFNPVNGNVMSNGFDIDGNVSGVDSFHSN